MAITPIPLKPLARALQSAWPLAFALAGSAAPAQAAPIALQQAPRGMATETIPNIIISVDNSSSMGAAGILALKNALKATFSTANLADDRVRLAWQAMHGCNTLPATSASQLSTCKGFNGIRRFSGQHRENFNLWVDSITQAQGTPTHWVMKNAGDYLADTTLGIHSPWAFDPGVQEAPLLGCRRSYHILMTDGEYGHSAWTKGFVDMSGTNGERIVRGKNADGTAIKLPDGTVYTPETPPTRLYSDPWGSDTHSSLADLSFHYWSRDLQPTIDNEVVPPAGQRAIDENFGTTTAEATLAPYWNPRNNPATWQHMVTYTIGFQDAARWTGLPEWKGDTHTGLGGLIRGDTEWVTPFCGPNSTGAGNLPCDGSSFYLRRGEPRKAELWHTALNSRGRFVPAPDANALVQAFNSILDDINVPDSGGSVSIAGTSGRHAATRLAYEASFDSARWRGDVTARTVSPEAGSRPSAPAWAAASLLDAMTTAQRAIHSHNGTRGIDFDWSQLDAVAAAALRGSDPVTVGANRVAYLRGDRNQEVAKGGTMRDRDSRLGSIINSNLWVTTAPRRLPTDWAGHARFRADNAARSTMVYVGAADGMLHGFDGSTGVERLAYVPRALFGELQAHTRPGWTYRALFDGHPFTGDANLAASPSADPAWSTVLVSGLGAGARGYVVLDVNQLDSRSASHVLLDHTSSSAVPATHTGHEDVGHLMAAPVVDGLLSLRSEQIVKLNNGRWAAVMGNGVNSANERPVLLIQHLDGDRTLATIVADSTLHKGNGLAPPRLIDVDANGTMDIAYAGDLHGRLWKFDLTATDELKWGVAVWNGSGSVCKGTPACEPFAKAVDPGNPAVAQPITTAPAWMPHPLGGIQLLFGTGQLLATADAATTAVQTVYSLWDKSSYPKDKDGVLSSLNVARLDAADIRTRLVAQPVGAALPVTDTSGTVHPDAYFGSANNAVTYSKVDETAPRGWYVDLPVTGERLVVHPHAFLGRKAIFVTSSPSAASVQASCRDETNGDQHWFNVRDMITGAPPVGGVFYASAVTTSIESATRASVPGNEFVLMPSGGEGFNLQMPGKTGVAPESIVDVAVPMRRVEWRDIRP